MRPIRMRVPAGVLFSMLVVVPMASAKDFAWSGGAWTSVSGHTGSNSKTLKASSSHALTSLQFWEKADDPVRIQVTVRTLCSKGRCSTKSLGYLQTGSASGNFTSSQSVSVGAGHFVTAIQVCTTDKKQTGQNKLKGVRLWGAELKKSGELKPAGSVNEFKRTNCAKWRTKRSCASGKVATGIKGYYNTSTGFRGLSLFCSKPL